jgi:hypothetical protein
LGLKNVFVTAPLEADQFEEMKGSFSNLQPISYEDARSLILGAIEYAQGIGFKPHADWKSAQFVVEGGRPFEPKFTFGKDGKPLYVQGPDDNVEKIMSQLAPLIDQGMATYICAPFPDEWNEEEDEDGETRFA